MRYPAGCVPVFLCTMVLGAAAEVPGDGAVNPQSDQADTLRGQPIGRGFVIYHGKYLPPPYVVARRGDELRINDRPIPTGGFAGVRRGRDGGRGDSPDGWRRSPSDDPRRMFARIEQRLNSRAVLIVLDDQTAGFVSDEEDGIAVLQILLSDASSQAKLESLINQEVEWITSTEWAKIVEAFDPTPDLAERIRLLLGPWEDAAQADPAPHGPPPLAAVFRSQPGKYTLTVVAMGLAVIAMGSLINHRPVRDARWRDVDANGDGMRMVVRNVVLLVLLGGLDLLCTLVAEQAGNFLELNPLAARFADTSLLLASFKGVCLLGACAILLTLRRYRGAQMASWWLCLICTFVAFRWLTYNSLFFT